MSIKVEKKKLLLTGIFAVAIVAVMLLMPRPNRHKYTYEENRPWGYSLLTAPFDITVYRDSATVRAMTDSIDRTLVPIFRRDEEIPARVVASVSASHQLT